MGHLTGMQSSELSRALGDSVIEPIAYGRVESLTWKPVEVAASCLKVSKILVPINFSTRTVGAVRYAAALAELFGASIWLLHVVPCDSFTHNLDHLGLIGSYDEVVSMGARLLSKLICAEIAPYLRGGTLLRVGDPVQEIIAAAKTLDMDLIILSSDGDSGRKHPLSIGVAERVVRQQPCLTLTLRHELLLSTRTVRTLPWKNILVPVDLTEFSRRTVKWAKGLAERLGAKITIRYAPGLFAESATAKTTQQSPLQDRESKTIELQLAEWANLEALGVIEVDLHPEMDKPSARVVGQMLSRAGSDLIVTRIPQYSWWHSLMHGDAAEQLRRVAPCPVLSVPEKDLGHLPMKQPPRTSGVKCPIALTGHQVSAPAIPVKRAGTVQPRRRALATVYEAVFRQLTFLMCGGAWRGPALLGMAGTAVVLPWKKLRGGGSGADLGGGRTKPNQVQTHALKTVPASRPTAYANVQSLQANVLPAKEGGLTPSPSNFLWTLYKQIRTAPVIRPGRWPNRSISIVLHPERNP